MASRKALGILIVLILVLAGCAGATLPPGEYDVYPRAGTVQPGEYTYRQDEQAWTVYLHREPATAATPSSTATAAPSDPTPTPEAARCLGRPAVDGVRVRSSPSTADLTNVVGSVGTADTLTIEARTTTGQWYQIYDGYVWASLISLDSSPACAALLVVPLTRLGLHLIYSAQADLVLRVLPQLGTLKGTDGTEAILRAAERQRPDVITVWRSIYLPVGKWDCPPDWGRGDPRSAADSWWSWQWITWQQRGLIGAVDYFEIRNECAFVGAWEVAFDLRLIQLANRAGVCLAMFSDAYGNPEIAQFTQRQPVLDAMLTQPCAPGRHHVVAAHIYEGVSGGPWKFGRYRLFLAALPERYRRLQWMITEYSYGDGRGVVDCAQLWTDAHEADAALGPEVIGIHLYSVGSGTEWSDVSVCIGAPHWTPPASFSRLN
jgi:hypothetical protein